ncbi:hypothetical protein N2152v2_005578 [Parachlorella kessleri]
MTPRPVEGLVDTLLQQAVGSPDLPAADHQQLCLDDDSSSTSCGSGSEDGSRVEAGAEPKGAPTSVDARSSALKALAGISSVVSKSRKVDAEALQQIKQQRAQARAAQVATTGGGSNGFSYGPGLLGSRPHSPLPHSGGSSSSSNVRRVSFDSSTAPHSSLFRQMDPPCTGSIMGAVSSPLLEAAVGPQLGPAVLQQPHASTCFPLLPPAPGQPLLLPQQQQQPPGRRPLRPQRSVPASFHSAAAKQKQHAQQYVAGAGPGAPAALMLLDPSGAQGLTRSQPPNHPQQLAAALGDAGLGAVGAELSPPFVELLSTLSVGELVSLKAAVELLIAQHAAAYAATSCVPAAPDPAPQAILMQQAEQALQQAQRAEHALQQLQQAQRAQQAAAILHSLSVAAAGGEPSMGTGYSPPNTTFVLQRHAPHVPQQNHHHRQHQQAQQPVSVPPTPFTGGGQGPSSRAPGAARSSYSPNPSPSDATGRHSSGSLSSLSPADSGPLADPSPLPAAEHHLLGNLLSSALEPGTSSRSVLEASGWGAANATASATTQSTCFNNHLGEAGEGAPDVTALLQSLSLSLTPWADDDQVTTPSLAMGSSASSQSLLVAPTLPQRPGAAFPPVPRRAFSPVTQAEQAASPTASFRLPVGY